MGERTWFPKLGSRAYVAHAAVAPLSEPSRRMLDEAADDYASGGRLAFPKWVAQRERVRAKLGRLIGARADDIALVQSTAHGLQAVALGIRWQRGERIAVIRGEYPTNVCVWQRVAERFGLEEVVRGATPVGTCAYQDQR